jgi:tryptophan-rich sensory protein
MAEVVALWLSVALMMLLSHWLAGIAPRFMLPYLLWVGFAAWLNLAIIRLDGAFG